MLALSMDETLRGSPLPPAAMGRLRAQEPMAFRAFVVSHQRQVFALLSRMTGRGPHVDDLAQETFLRAYRALPRFDPAGPAKLSTWLLTIATNLALDERKKKRTVPLDPADAAGAISSEATPERALAQRRLARAIEDAARALPDDQCAALVLAELQGLTMQEIAQVLGIPEATAKTRLFRAREKMRAALAPFADMIRSVP